NDVPPRRNLPGEAEQWGRWMEDDQNLLKGAVISQGQSLQGLNRSTAASLASISDQLTAISGVLTTLSDQQTQLTNQVDALPVTTVTQMDLGPLQMGVNTYSYTSIPGPGGVPSYESVTAFTYVTVYD